jgi:hypothetical protein
MIQTGRARPQSNFTLQMYSTMGSNSPYDVSNCFPLGGGGYHDTTIGTAEPWATRRCPVYYMNCIEGCHAILQRLSKSMTTSVILPKTVRATFKALQVAANVHLETRAELEKANVR